MKKLIVLLLALAVTAGAFAQAAPAPAPALTFSGYLNTGFQYTSSDGYVYLWNADAGNMTRVRWNMAYTNGDFGVNFRIQNSDVGVTTGTQLFTQALVWGNLFGNMATFKAGKLNDYTWATPYSSWGNFDGKTGLQVQVKPTSALNVGFFVPLAATKSVTVADTFADASLAAKFTVKDVGTFLANLDLGTTANAVYASANVTAVKDLTLMLEAKVADLTAVDANTTLRQYASYALGDASVGVYVEETLLASFGWAVCPEATYTMGKTELGASFWYDSTDYYSADAYAKFTLGAKSAAKVYAGYDGGVTLGTNFLYSF